MERKVKRVRLTGVSLREKRFRERERRLLLWRMHTLRAKIAVLDEQLEVMRQELMRYGPLPPRYKSRVTLGVPRRKA